MTFRSATPSAPYGGRGRDIVGSAIDASLSVLARLDRPVISFAMGSPAADAIPRGQIAAAAAATLGPERGADALDYAPTEGHPVLRTALLRRLDRIGSPTDPDSLLITTGGMQGIDLVCRLFLDPGDLVLAESPSYANGLATLLNHGAQVVQVPLDADGMDLDLARAAIASAGRSPRLMYVIPSFQNPSGLTWSQPRRVALLELARSEGAIVLEDDPYRELSYGVPVPPSLLELDAGAGSVIAVHTFSKIVAPGLRCGWVVAPPDAIRRMVAARQSMDTCATTPSQYVVARLIESGALDEHVAHLRQLYPRRRDLMLDALERHLGCHEDIRWTRPRGGMFVWLDLPAGVDGEDVLMRGLEAGVAVVPGAAFDPIRCRAAVRLCFTAQPDAAIESGIERLAATISGIVDGSVAASG